MCQLSAASKQDNAVSSESAILTLIDPATRKVIDVFEVATATDALTIYRQHTKRRRADAHIHTCSYDRLILSLNPR